MFVSIRRHSHSLAPCVCLLPLGRWGPERSERDAARLSVACPPRRVSTATAAGRCVSSWTRPAREASQLRKETVRARSQASLSAATPSSIVSIHTHARHLIDPTRQPGGVDRERREERKQRAGPALLVRARSPPFASPPVRAGRAAFRAMSRTSAFDMHAGHAGSAVEMHPHQHGQAQAQSPQARAVRIHIQPAASSQENAMKSDRSVPARPFGHVHHRPSTKRRNQGSSAEREDEETEHESQVNTGIGRTALGLAPMNLTVSHLCCTCHLLLRAVLVIMPGKSGRAAVVR